MLSDKTFIEARYSGFWLHSSNDPNEDGSARVQTAVRGPGHRPDHGRHHELVREPQLALRAIRRSCRTWSTTSLGGSHDWKLGLQYGGHGSDNLNGPNDTFTDLQRDGPADDRHHAAALSPGRDCALASGAYVDDTYRLGRATVNLGVRYDYSKGDVPGAAVPRRRRAVRPARCRAANDDVYHWNTFSPRVGVNYRVNDSGKTVVKAHYGRYYKAMEATEFRAGGAVDHAAVRFHRRRGRQPHQLRAGPRATPTCASTRTSSRRTATSSSSQFEQEVMTDLGVQVNYVHKRGGDYGAWQDIAGVVRRRCRTSTTSASTRPARR